MTTMKNTVIAAAVVVGLNACAQTEQNAPVGQTQDRSKVLTEQAKSQNELIRQTEERSKALNEKIRNEYVNSNWRVSCHDDAVTTSRRCFAGTFGEKMGHDGMAFGGKNIPFQVYYFNEEGPYISVGFHTFPGRTPTIRIDDDVPRETPSEPLPEVAQRLRTAHVVRARYHVWPRGAEDMIVDVSGFDEAWQQLTARLQEGR